MQTTIECAHCKSIWVSEPNCILVLGPNQRGCSHCNSESGMATLGEAIRAGHGVTHLQDRSGRRIPLIPGDDPLAVQVGGDHYKSMKIQPVEFIEKNNIPFLEGNVIKYVVRHVGKGGVADLRKAKHYIDLLLSLRYGETP